MTCKLSNEYIAGFFDGEGCVSSQMQWVSGKYIKFPRVSVHISITQNTTYILRLIQGVYGGKINVHNRENTCYNLRLTGKHTMKKFLEAILPHAVVKKEQIEAGLEFIETIREDNLGCTPLNSSMHETRKGIHERLKLLKAS